MEPAQLGAWFERCAGGLILYARQWTDRGAAEDVVQEVFLRLMAQREAPDNVKAWLYTAVRNAVIDQRRSRDRRGRRELAASRLDCFEPDLDQTLDACAVAQALGKLDDSDREVVVLRIWGQLSFKEISSTVGQPLSTVYGQYHAALAQLKVRMETPCKTNL